MFLYLPPSNPLISNIFYSRIISFSIFNLYFELFKLQEIYQISHIDEISDIIRKYHISGGKYLEVLHHRFPDLGSVEDLYKIGFANYYNEEDFGQRPLGKLTKDIVDQLSFVIPKIQ